MENEIIKITWQSFMDSKKQNSVSFIKTMRNIINPLMSYLIQLLCKSVWLLCMI